MARKYRQGMESGEKTLNQTNRRDFILNLGILATLGGAALYASFRSLKYIDWENFDWRIKPEISYSTEMTESLEQRIKYLHSVLQIIRNPILISTYEEFDKIRNNPEGNFRLKNNICIPEGCNFKPIGTCKKPFKGILDGQDYMIRGLKINTPNSSCNVGLFSVIDRDSILSNIILQDIDIVGGNSVGTLVGSNFGGSVLNCSIRGGKIHGFSSTGAFIGYNYNGIVVNPFVYANVSVDQDAVGMVVGTNHEGSIINPSGEGNVFGKVHVGALVGANQGGDIINPNIKAKDREDKLIEKLVGIDYPTLRQNPYETDDSLM